MKPYPYKGKKDDPIVFTFSQKSIDKYETSNYPDGGILWSERINQENQNGSDTSYDAPFSHTQKETQHKDPNLNQQKSIDGDDSFSIQFSHTKKETKKKRSRLLRFLFGCIGRK